MESNTKVKSDIEVVVQSVRFASGELGPLSASSIALGAMLDANDDELLRIALAEHQRELAVLDSIVRAGLTPCHLLERVSGCLAKLSEEIDAARTVVVLGVEALFLDELVDRFPDKEVFIVPHDGCVDLLRVSSNLPPSAQLTDLQTFMSFAGGRSLLLAPVFGTVFRETFTHFVTARAIGKDVSERFCGVIAVDLLGTQFGVFPKDLVQVPTSDFTALVLP